MTDIAGSATIPLILGALFLVGLAADLIGRFTFLPRVTLLLLAGLAIGPSGFSLLPEAFVTEWFPILTNVALALIGFLLGHELSISALRKRGNTVIGISLCKVFGTWLAVGLALLLIGVDPVIALLLAGVAPATAPAAVYDVVKESGATGDFSETLLSVVALDDVWGLLMFIVMMACASIVNGDAAVVAGIEASVIEIGSSILLGAVLGFPMAYLTGRIRHGEPTLAEALGFVLLAAGIAELIGALPILTTMVMGITVASLAAHHERPFHAIEGIEWPFMILFFVLAGASLQLNTLAAVGGLAVLYVVSRCVGIYFGTLLGGRITHYDRSLQKWLALAQFPQAGVAIGMALLAAQQFPDIASEILTVVVASTIVLEIFGPILTRHAIRVANSQ